MRALELYAGIGGFAAAAEGRLAISCAVEQSNVALSVYRTNFPHHEALEKNIAGLRAEDLARHDADLWWVSPPCQPFTARGNFGDLQDSRTRSFRHLLSLIREVRPRAVALENVPGFGESLARSALLDVLDSGGYRFTERLLCPTELGVPNRRLRYYLAASIDGVRAIEVSPRAGRLADYLGRGDSTLELDEETLAKYRHAMSIIDPRDERAIAACFTSAYGRSPVRSGSFLAMAGQGSRVRRFSPREILRLLGFGDEFVLTSAIDRERTYMLVGNSLSIPAVRAVLSALDIDV